jgi:hypothetical protein
MRSDAIWGGVCVQSASTPDAVQYVREKGVLMVRAAMKEKLFEKLGDAFYSEDGYTRVFFGTLGYYTTLDEVLAAIQRQYRAASLSC